MTYLCSMEENILLNKDTFDKVMKYLNVFWLTNEDVRTDEFNSLMEELENLN